MASCPLVRRNTFHARLLCERWGSHVMPEFQDVSYPVDPHCQDTLSSLPPSRNRVPGGQAPCSLLTTVSLKPGIWSNRCALMTLFDHSPPNHCPAFESLSLSCNVLDPLPWVSQEACLPLPCGNLPCSHKPEGAFLNECLMAGESFCNLMPSVSFGIE